MRNERSFSLPYLRVDAIEYETFHGYEEITNLEYYNGQQIRNRVISRFDAFGVFRSIFTDENYEKFRELIFSLASGNLNETEKISQILQTFYLHDRKFRTFIGEIVYFDLESQNKSLYSLVVGKMKRMYLEERDTIIDRACNLKLKYLFTAHGYVYVAVPDDFGTVSIPKGYKLEVISCAKNWAGNVQEV